jgi:polysaccharide pyruvyl transferase WcaK-like protein
MLVLLQAYSNGNAGDGLLVEESVRLFKDAGVDPTDVTVAALDSASFSGRPYRIHEFPPGPSKVRGALVGAASMAVPNPALLDLCRRADAVIGVGGGYLRAGGLDESVTTVVAHLSQIRVAVACGRPSVYLPQSIGPLHGATGKLVTSMVSRLDRVYVRDDKSMQELGYLPNVRRAPDLVAMRIGEQLERPSLPGGGPIVVVARALKDAAGYVERLTELRRQLPDAIWAVQSSVRDHDDAAFYEQIGVPGPWPKLSDVLDGPQAGVVVSVRLHGSLTALWRGWPSIHLSYERKGPGAYGDLGVQPYLHEARTFDPAVVASQARELARDSGDFFDALGTCRTQLSDARKELVETVRTAVHEGRRGS